jgi:hypothetical protein
LVTIREAKREATDFSVSARRQKNRECLFAEGFAGLQPVQALNQHERSTVGPHQDRRLLAPVEHAHRYFINALLFEGRAPFDWHVDVSDREVSVSSWAHHAIAFP